MRRFLVMMFIFFITLTVSCSQFIVVDPPDNMDYALIIKGPMVLEQGVVSELSVEVISAQPMAIPDIAWTSSSSSAVMLSPRGEFCGILGLEPITSLRITATSLDGLGVSTDFLISVVDSSDGTNSTTPSEPTDKADSGNTGNEEPPPEEPPSTDPVYDASAFVTIWSVPENTEIRLPLEDNKSYDIAINWGDTVESSSIELFPEQYQLVSKLGVLFDKGSEPEIAISHKYERAGEYTVVITGDLNLGDWSFREYPVSKDLLVKIEQWGDADFSATSNTFYGCSNLQDMPALDASIFGTDMSYLFYGASSFNGDIGDWDVSGVKNMNYLFAGATSFDGDISNWDVGQVLRMDSMFEGATSFNGDISNWDVGQVLDMNSMFAGATSFNRDISNWNVGQVQDMGSMFEGATSFNGNISNWDVGQVQDMNSMFAGAVLFNRNIGGWIVTKVRDMSSMFQGATSFNRDISDWDVGQVKSMNAMFADAISFNNGDITEAPEGLSFKNPLSRIDEPIQSIAKWNVSQVVDFTNMFLRAESFYQNLSDWELMKRASMSDMFLDSAMTNTDYHPDGYSGD